MTTSWEKEQVIACIYNFNYKILLPNNSSFLFLLFMRYRLRKYNQWNIPLNIFVIMTLGSVVRKQNVQSMYVHYLILPDLYW